MSDDVHLYYLKNFPLFCNLQDHQLKAVRNVVRFRQGYRGEGIDYGNEAFSKIFFLMKGTIKITNLDEHDNELVKDIATAGDVFGDLELEGAPTANEFAEVLTANTIICWCYSNDFKTVMEANPVLALNYARQVSNKLKRLENRHADLVFRDAKARLIRFIRQWAKSDGSRVGDKIVLNNYLTHTDIANFISTSRQSVNVLLNELRDSGLLHYNRKCIELNNAPVWN